MVIFSHLFSCLFRFVLQSVVEVVDDVIEICTMPKTPNIKIPTVRTRFFSAAAAAVRFFSFSLDFIFSLQSNKKKTRKRKFSRSGRISSFSIEVIKVDKDQEGK